MNIPEFWKSLDQLDNNIEFQKIAEREFLSSPFMSKDEVFNEIGRRDFIKFMGASLALASTACIRRPVNKIVPYVNRPVEIVPGIANYYASSWADGSEVFGLVVKTREGRPIKIEGNPDFPLNKGALSARAQAHVLSLYDPERFKGPRKNLFNESKTNFDTVSVSWDKVDKEVVDQLKKGKAALLTSTVVSPSFQSVLDQFKNLFGVSHYEWDPQGSETVREAQKLSYGAEMLPRYRFDQAQIVVSIGADFLGTYLQPVEFSKSFHANRKPGSEMNRLIVFESLSSLTGANADIRVQLAPSQYFDLVMALIYEIVVHQNGSHWAGQDSLMRLLRPYESVAAGLGIDPGILKKTATDLLQARGKGVVIAGGLVTATPQELELQIAVNLLNSLLENDGKTIDYSNPRKTRRGSLAQISKLVERINAGEIKTLIVHGVNPAYNLSPDAGFKEAVKKLEMLVSTGDRLDELGKISHFVACDHHALENWGDFEPYGGLLSIQQPTIRPLYETRAFQETLMAWCNLERPNSFSQDWAEYLKKYWEKNIFNKVAVDFSAKNFEDFWIEVLQRGFVGKLKDNTSPSRRLDSAAYLRLAYSGRATNTGLLELAVYSTTALSDGSLANVSWLQELPDPVTKVMWDNYLTISPKLARQLKAKDGDIINVSTGVGHLRVPLLVQPGQHAKTVGLAIGYGRKGAGSLCEGVGTSAYELCRIQSGRGQFSAIPVILEMTSEKYPLASSQDHHSMEGRSIAATATLQEYLKNPKAGVKEAHVFSIWDEFKYPGYKWAMAIDTNSCTGCSACVVACQSENNIPVVGKERALLGREMHWIRIDRYYQGSAEDPQSVFQPMLCQHCDNAPCETVCPVVATTHSNEGLNEMTYNRCVGTRYCSNNCPYKVRRFNWFNYSEVSEPQSLAFNPDVTVRSRGVMEKCTFCVQRIKEAKNKALDSGGLVADGDIQTACQQTCPTQAIVFGNMNDPKSRVSQLFANERTYSVLQELNTVPNVRYQSKIRNLQGLAMSDNSDKTPPKTHEKAATQGQSS